MRILTQYKKHFNRTKEENMYLESFLKKLKTDKSLYSSPYERLLKAIGEPELINTSTDSKLSRIFGNRTIKVYKTFKQFFGMEDTIDRIVAFLKHASQGLEESKQILYLLGPVGSAKSSLAERLKELMEESPIYVLKYEDELSPLRESPLSLFDESKAEELGIPARALRFKLSPWARKRLDQSEGDLSKFSVAKVYPSQLNQLAITKTEPGDENNQDISSLVGKINIRMLEHHNQDDPDAYSFTGGLCLGNRGILEFVEMFKAPIKMLHPLLTATQESNYIGTEQIGSIPFDGIILAP
jgi:serine protein kinase